MIKKAVCLAAIAAVAAIPAASQAGVAPPASQARVLSIKAYISPGCYPACVSADRVTLVLFNDSRRKYVKVSLVAFYGYRLQQPPRVMRISMPALYVPKPNDEWLFRLRPGETKKVIFTIRHSSADVYCIGGSYYQTAWGRYTKCSN
jgi:hypothetical protein